MTELRMTVLGPSYADAVEGSYREKLGKAVGVTIPKGAYVSVGDDGVTRILTKDCRYEVDTKGNLRQFKRVCDAKCKGDSIQRNANRFGLIGNATYSKTGKTVGHLKPEARGELAELVKEGRLAGYRTAMNMQISEEAKAAENTPAAKKLDGELREALKKLK